MYYRSRGTLPFWKNVSISQLSRDIHISRNQIHKWKKHGVPTWQRVLQLSQVLDLPPKEIAPHMFIFEEERVVDGLGSRGHSPRDG